MSHEYILLYTDIFGNWMKLIDMKWNENVSEKSASKTDIFISEN